jgi:hypothetical protein
MVTESFEQLFDWAARVQFSTWTPQRFSTPHSKRLWAPAVHKPTEIAATGNSKIKHTFQHALT